MTIGTQDLSTANALFQEVYADKLINLVPESEILLKKISFVPSNKHSGGVYKQAVSLNRNHGATFIGNSDQNLDRPVPRGNIYDVAQIQASAIAMAGAVSQMALSRTEKNAFVSLTMDSVKNLSTSFSALQETVHHCGGSGLGTGVAKTATLAANGLYLTVDGLVTGNPTDFASAIWMGGEQMGVDIYNASTGAFVQSATVTAVDLATALITLDSVASLVDGTSYTLFRSGSKGLESLGLQSILSSTGTLFGIDSSIRKLWRANQYAAGSVSLSYKVLADAVSKARNRGLRGPITLLVNPIVFQSLFPNFETVKSSGATPMSRVFTSKDEVVRLEHGTDTISFRIGGIKVDVEACDYVKCGYAFGLDWSTWERVGSSEINFQPQMMDKSQGYFRPHPTRLEWVIDAVSDQALFCNMPSKNLYISGLVV